MVYSEMMNHAGEQEAASAPVTWPPAEGLNIMGKPSLAAGKNHVADQMECRACEEFRGLLKNQSHMWSMTVPGSLGATCDCGSVPG